MPNRAVKLVRVMLDFYGHTPATEEAITIWLRQEVGSTATISYDLLETMVDNLMRNKWAVGRLYLTEQRLGKARKKND